MAQKRKNRHLNVARKRAKRQQNQKVKRKQLAFQKQRALQTARSDEELLQDKIARSKLLLDEPEFENITFDPDLLQQKTMEALESDLFTSEGEEGEESTTEEADEAPEHISEVFRCKVLPQLITIEFSNAVSYALKACETRFKRMGYQQKAEIALVAKSLFEYADPETLAFHPLIFGICARTLGRILAAPEPVPDTVTSVFSDVLKVDPLPESEDPPEPPKEPDHVEEAVELASEPVAVPEPQADQTIDAEIVPPVPEVVPETLQAKALYKNADGLEIRRAIEIGDGYRVVQEADSQVELAHTDGQRYIILTTDRLLLQCVSKELLEVAMEEVEALCDDALFYLARTFDNP